MKISEAELAQRKNRVIHEGFQLFCEHGIDKVTVRDVAAKAKISEKSVYRYFNSKIDLVIAMVNVLWSEIVSELVSYLPEDYEDHSGIGQVECLLKCFRDLFEKHSPYIVFAYDYKLFLIRHNVFLPEEVYFSEIKPMHELYIKAFNKGMKDGSIQLHTDMEDMYYATWGLIRGYIVKIVIYDRMISGENMWLKRFDLACSMILKGLRHKD